MMETPVQKSWREANKDYLMARLESVRQALKHASGDLTAEQISTESPMPIFPTMEHETPPALDVLGSLFDLSTFERDILLLCAGIELDSDFARLCAEAQDDPEMDFPTFNLALTTLPGAFWSALSPDSPLRHWRLIEVEPGRSLTLSPLCIDERILHFLVGVSCLDRRLAGLFQPLSTIGALVPSQQKISEELSMAWLQSTKAPQLPIMNLCGNDIICKRNIAVTACSLIDYSICSLSAAALPTSPADLQNLLLFWERERHYSVTGCFYWSMMA